MTANPMIIFFVPVGFHRHVIREWESFWDLIVFFSFFWLRESCHQVNFINFYQNLINHKESTKNSLNSNDLFRIQNSPLYVARLSSVMTQVYKSNLHKKSFQKIDKKLSANPNTLNQSCTCLSVFKCKFLPPSPSQPVRASWNYQLRPTSIRFQR